MFLWSVPWGALGGRVPLDRGALAQAARGTSGVAAAPGRPGTRTQTRAHARELTHSLLISL